MMNEEIKLEITEASSDDTENELTLNNNVFLFCDENPDARKSYIWSREATNAFLRFVSLNYESLSVRRMKKTLIWKNIASEMQDLFPECDLTAYQCELKWRRLIMGNKLYLEGRRKRKPVFFDKVQEIVNYVDGMVEFHIDEDSQELIVKSEPLNTNREEKPSVIIGIPSEQLSLNVSIKTKEYSNSCIKSKLNKDDEKLKLLLSRNVHSQKVMYQKVLKRFSAALDDFEHKFQKKKEMLMRSLN